MVRDLYPRIYSPLTKSASVFLRADPAIVARNFSRPINKPKINNWRLTPITDGFDFVDGTGFDFMDGAAFDFMDA